MVGAPSEAEGHQLDLRASQELAWHPLQKQGNFISVNNANTRMSCNPTYKKRCTSQSRCALDMSHTSWCSVPAASVTCSCVLVGIPVTRASSSSLALRTVTHLRSSCGMGVSAPPTSSTTGTFALRAICTTYPARLGQSVHVHLFLWTAEMAFKREISHAPCI